MESKPAPLRILSPIHRAGRQFGLYFEERAAELGVSTVEGHVLAYLNVYAPCSVAELRRVFGYKKSSLTGVLDRLVERGWALRDVDPADRRSFLVRLTPEGSTLAGRVRKITDAFETAVISRISAADLRAFGRVMKAIEAVTGIEVRTSGKPAGSRAESGAGVTRKKLRGGKKR
ncbi:MAG: MarR family transcriptional regulator [Candidatus Eisenbacteria bacterium]|uniref:MarR family transcriptional regulator n=1 Tax=Eiseniibacteriota bacterium TaxID=2212470 RepID=A0A956LWF7_UNCEI|nr:MarR family transcriptional regulator [Candidatus Eisenbacteria bacterium]